MRAWFNSESLNKARMNPTDRQCFARGLAAEMSKLPVQSLELTHRQACYRQSQNKSSDHRRE